jgi:hypothetical protein
VVSLLLFPSEQKEKGPGDDDADDGWLTKMK